jgi:hypothetical protein
MDNAEEKLILRLRPFIEGQRVLLVSDRRKAAVEDELRERLGLEVTWIDSKRPRKLQSAQAGVSAGSCDLVLVATSFVGHNVDRLLKPACKQRGIPFLAAKKGRLLSYVTALATWALPDPGARRGW